MGFVQQQDIPDRGAEIGRRVLGTDAQLNRMAGLRNIGLRRAQPLARRDTQLLGDQIEARDHLGHRMFDLKAGVHFEKVEGPVLRIDELDGSGTPIVDGARNSGGGFADLVPLFGRKRGRGRFLDDLLEPALDRAFALPEMDHVALPVAHHLHLDMARTFDIAFDEETTVAEIPLAFAAGGFDLGFQRAVLAHDAHALAAAPRRRLDQQRIAQGAGAFDKTRRIVILDRRRGNRKAARLDKGARADLVAHQVDGLGGRADKCHTDLFQRRDETGILRQKAVAGMHRIRADLSCGRNDLRNIEIGRYRRRAVDHHNLIRDQMGRPILFGDVAQHSRRKAAGLGGAHHTRRDFTPIGDQEF